MINEDLRSLANICTMLHIRFSPPHGSFIVHPVVTVHVEMCMWRCTPPALHGSGEVYSMTECQDKISEGWGEATGLRMQNPPSNFTWQWLLYPVACDTLENDFYLYIEAFIR